jgi:superfamily II DNA or RNA helicase
MTRIFDNIERDFGSHLTDTLKQSQRLDAAVGYFNLRGWNFFAEGIEEKEFKPGSSPVARILIGMANADPNEKVIQYLQSKVDGSIEYEDDNEKAREFHSKAIEQFREQLCRGLPTKNDLETLRLLKEHLLSGKVQLKLFLKRPLHGKVYLCHRPEDLNNQIVGFVGSSNLTFSGLQHNYELNVDVLDDQATNHLAKWFQDRWEDSHCIDITAELIELIDNSWVNVQTPTPYELYLKICWHLSRDVREGLLEYSIPEKLKSQLLTYQESAVKALARRVESRGGTMLGDVVGLGKTITATAVASMLSDSLGYPLVICPVNLKPMWESYLETYDLPGKVVPYSQISRVLPNLNKRYRFVIIDESHTLRNSTRQDYKILRQYLQESDSKVLLLTGTPFNIRFKDVANQIALYLDDDEDLGIQPLAAMDKNPRLVDLVDGKISSLAAFKRSEEAEDWKRLMSDHLIRRTRSFIQKNYALHENDKEYLQFSNGEKFFFPKRIAIPLGTDESVEDPATKMASEETLGVIDSLKLPRYSLARYVNSEVELNDKEEVIVEKWEQSSGHLSGFLRSGFYKRLSSCGYSFILSIQKHLARNDVWIYAYTNNLSIPLGNLPDDLLEYGNDGVLTTEIDDDFEFESNFEDLPMNAYKNIADKGSKSMQWVRSSIFTDELVEHLRNDSTVLRELLSNFGIWDHSKDPKILKLVELINKTHKSQKVLIFTEYKDTANYVSESLSKMGVKKVEVVSGSSSNPMQLACRFSPRSNANLVGESDKNLEQIDVLVSTDVLSEGQNLQDSSVQINYDLPWAIVRLIQRAGRIDRVGQQSPNVHIYSFFPGDTVETVLNLRSRIRERLEKNAQVFGSDEKFFGTEAEQSMITELYKGHLVDEDDSENDASSLAYEVWNEANLNHPEIAQRVLNMPDLVYSTREHEVDEEQGVGVFARTERNIDSFASINKEGKVKLLTAHEALNYFHAEPVTPTAMRLDDHFELVSEIVSRGLQKSDVTRGRLRGIRARIWKRFNGSLQSAEEHLGNALDSLYTRPLTSEAESILRGAMRTQGDEDVAALIISLHLQQRLTLASDGIPDPLRIVCSLGVR